MSGESGERDLWEWGLTWKTLVWNLVKEHPIRRSSSCRASTDLDSFSLGRPRFWMAVSRSGVVRAENLARNNVCEEEEDEG